MPRRFPASIAWMILGLLCFSAGCKQDEPPPRSRDDVFFERLKLPALYLSADGKTRVIAPANRGLFVDEKSGEICWPALMCQSPECPGRKADGQPFVFVLPDPSIYVKPDGTFGTDSERAEAAKDQPVGCPLCMKDRNLATESPQQRQHYIDWIQPYVLPETAKRLQELDDEDRRREELFQQRKNRKPS